MTMRRKKARSESTLLEKLPRAILNRILLVDCGAFNFAISELWFPHLRNGDHHQRRVHGVNRRVRKMYILFVIIHFSNIFGNILTPTLQ